MQFSHYCTLHTETFEYSFLVNMIVKECVWNMTKLLIIFQTKLTKLKKKAVPEVSESEDDSSSNKSGVSALWNQIKIREHVCFGISLAYGRKQCFVLYLITWIWIGDLSKLHVFYQNKILTSTHINLYHSVVPWNTPLCALSVLVIVIWNSSYLALNQPSFPLSECRGLDAEMSQFIQIFYLHYSLSKKEENHLQIVMKIMSWRFSNWAMLVHKKEKTFVRFVSKLMVNYFSVRDHVMGTSISTALGWLLLLLIHLNVMNAPQVKI